MILSLNNIYKSYIYKEILNNVSFNINKNDKVGLVGDNGSGKTTLFKIISDLESVDSGDIYIRRGYEPSYLKQHTSIDSSNTVYQEVMSHYDDLIDMENKIRQLEKDISELDPNSNKIDAIFRKYSNMQEEFIKLGGPEVDSRVKGVLRGLGFDDNELMQKVNNLSGGQKSRVELAKLLLSDSKLLLLDEPTNHLDMDAINWLEGYLRDYDGAYIVISHDRYFLDRTVNRVLLLENQSIYSYNGNYSNFVTQRSKDVQIQQRQYENQQAKIEAEKEIIERYLNTGKANIYRQGLSRQRRLEAKLEDIELIDPVHESKQASISFKSNITPGKDIYRGSDLSFSYNGNKIFEDIDLEVYRKDRIGLIGPNGVGKTTLLKILADKLKSDSGELKFGTNIDIGYFDQEMSGLDPNKSVIDDVWDSFPTLDHYDIRSYLARMNFVGEDILATINTLSGGEQSRIALLKLMMSGANVLLMDEPTNHLDIDSKEMLEESIESYDGTVIAVSHDRYFLNNFASKIWELQPDSLTEYLGNYDYYVQKKAELNATPEDTTAMTQTERQQIQKIKRQEQRRLQKLNKQSKNIQEEIQKLDHLIEDIDKQLYTPEIASDYIKATELTELRDSYSKEQDYLFEQWMEIENSK